MDGTHAWGKAAATDYIRAAVLVRPLEFPGRHTEHCIRQPGIMSVLQCCVIGPDLMEQIGVFLSTFQKYSPMNSY